MTKAAYGRETYIHAFPRWFLKRQGNLSERKRRHKEKGKGGRKREREEEARQERKNESGVSSNGQSLRP